MVLEVLGADMKFSGSGTEDKRPLGRLQPVRKMLAAGKGI